MFLQLLFGISPKSGIVKQAMPLLFFSLSVFFSRLSGTRMSAASYEAQNV
jgi:hypothetical protein